MKHNPGKTKDKIIGHLILDHALDHIVSRAEGGTRLATPIERRRLYGFGWTVNVLRERHTMFHETRDAT